MIDSEKITKQEEKQENLQIYHAWWNEESSFFDEIREIRDYMQRFKEDLNEKDETR